MKLLIGIYKYLNGLAAPVMNEILFKRNLYDCVISGSFHLPIDMGLKPYISSLDIGKHLSLLSCKPKIRT